MKRNSICAIVVGCLMLVLQFGCSADVPEKKPVKEIKAVKVVKPSPDAVREMLKEGNGRFISGASTYPHQDALRLSQAGSEDQGDHAYATV